MRKLQRFCIFCGGAGLSKEHFFAEWMHDYLPEVASNHQITGTDLIGKPGKMRRPGGLHLRHLRVVCQKCNSGWMSELQREAKPILIPLMQGTWRELDPNSERILGAWEAMFAMVVEYARDDMRMTPPEQRKFLMDHQTAPKGWHIWMALLGAPCCSFAQAIFGPGPDKETQVPANMIKHGQVIETITLAGRLVFGALGFTERQLEARNIAALRVNARVNGFRQIWPKQNVFARRRPATNLTMTDARGLREGVWRIFRS